MGNNMVANQNKDNTNRHTNLEGGTFTESQTKTKTTAKEYWDYGKVVITILNIDKETRGSRELYDKVIESLKTF